MVVVIRMIEIYIVETMDMPFVLGWGCHIVAEDTLQVFIGMLDAEQFMSLKHDRCRCAHHFTGHGAAVSAVIVGDERSRFVVVGCLQA